MPRQRTTGARAGRAWRGRARGDGHARRAAMLACAAGVTTLAVLPSAAAASSATPAQAVARAREVSPAQGGAAARQVSVAITSITPDVAVRRQPVTISGTVTNGTASAVSGLAVQIRSSGTALGSRASLQTYAAGTNPADGPVSRAIAKLPASLAAGASETWSVVLRPSAIGISAFGVYPLAAQLNGAGGALSTARTFLPFWPGKSEQRKLKPVQIAWVWPLISSPQQAACPAMASNVLATSVAAGGRLNRILAAGRTPSAISAHLTWAIDPALLSEVAAMRKPYLVGGNATCGRAVRKPALAAAQTWLSGVSTATARQDFFTTPYADVDAAALIHHGLDANLASAFRDGRSVAASTLGQAQRPVITSAVGTAGASSAVTGGIAWPADGQADYGVLGGLAVNKIGTVILDSTMMPPRAPASYTPSAVTETPDGVGSDLHVLLADHELTQILGTRASSSAAASGTGFATEQRFLAETAMIAAEAPSTGRSLVVAPPQRWDPAPGEAGALLQDTTTAPWLRSASLAQLVSQGSTSGQVARQAPPRQQTGRGELRAALMRKLSVLESRIALQGNVFYPPRPGYLARAIAAIESSAWRGTRADQRRAGELLRRVSTYVSTQERKVSIIGVAHITLGGKSGSVPVSIHNGLSETIRVKLKITVPSGGMLDIQPFKDHIVTVGPRQQRIISVPVRAAAAGTTTLRLSLTTVNGTVLPGSGTTLTLQATQFGKLALVIIGVALAVFVIATAARAIRRGRNPPGGAASDDGPADGPEAGQDGAIAPGGDGEADTVSEGSVPDDPPEEPDEYASAPGRADRT